MAEQPAASKPAGKSKRLPLVLGLVLGVAVLEGAAFFLVFKLRGGGPAVARGETSRTSEGGEGEGEGAAAPAPTSAPSGHAEVAVLRNLRVPNEKSGRMWIYDMDISVVVSSAEKERVENLVKQRGGEIGDTLARIVRSAPDRMLRETDLRALRYQVQEALREISGEENLVQRVLIPRFVPIPAD